MAVAESWTTLKLLAWTQDYFAVRGVENSRREAEWLLCAATGLDRVGLYLNFEKPLMPDELAVYRDFVSRRAKREPLQHIIGTEEFSGRDFIVSPDVLIPRHDSETLIEEALRRTPDAATILDIGTGSGCLAVTLALDIAGATVTAVDISRKALDIAEQNARQLGAQVEFLHGSLFQPVAGRRFNLIVSNPPYIPTADIESLQPEVRDYDPRIALDGGVDGLQIYATLIPAATGYLTEGGWLLVEIGSGQAEHVCALFRQTAGFGEPVTVLDHGGIIRVVGAQHQSSGE